MYELKVKDSIFTIPKKNILLLAMQKSFDLCNCHVKLENEMDAVNYLRSIGIEVSEV